MEGPRVLISEVKVVSKETNGCGALRTAQSKYEVSEVGWLKGKDTQKPQATNL